MLLEIQKINVGARARPVTDARVDALISSIADVGLLNPVTVVKEMVIHGGRSVEGYTLIAGAHRLEAMRRRGDTEIEATVVDMDKHERLLAECDENLCGTNLGAGERAMLTAIRKSCYEFLHPETAHGAIGGGHDKQSRQLGDSAPERFTTDTAETTGRAERSVQRDAERGEKILPVVMSKIIGTKLDTGTFLDEIKELPNNEQVAFVRRCLKRKNPTPKKSKSSSRKPADKLKSLKKDWLGLSPDDQERVLRGLPDAALMAEVRRRGLVDTTRLAAGGTGDSQP